MKKKLFSGIGWLILLFLTKQLLHAQVFFEREDIAIAAGWKNGHPITSDFTQRGTYRDALWRKKMLPQFPVADTNGDGVLSEREAITYHIAQVRRFTVQGEELQMLPRGTRHWTERVPMSDGESLPVEVFLPAGDGPWPAVLVRTARGRIDSALDYGNELLRLGYAFVGGDLTPEGDFVNADLLGVMEADQPITREERASLNARRSRRDSARDGADTLAWIARQQWSNGRIGMTGYSEASGQTKNALSTHPPDLDLVVSAIGTISGTSRRLGGGGSMSVSGFPELPQSWQAPSQDPGQTPAGRFLGMEKVPDVIYNDRTGWFDFPVQGAIMEWMKMRENGRSTLIIGIGGHGSISFHARMPPNYGDCDLLFPEIKAFEVLKEESNGKPQGSRFYYFLMGDAVNPSAPGNVWKVTETWPVTDNLISWYLAPEGKLQAAPPAEEVATAGYTYDPRKPVLTAGGSRMPSEFNGPRDQSGLDGRNDVLLFVSEPIRDPVEITGEARIDLYVSTDAPDTAFIVQLLDIYPDGYKWPIRDGEVIARYHTGSDGTQKLEAEKVYHLEIPLTATALVLNRGHRLGLQIMSSSFPSYAVHPNTWDSIGSYDESQLANQKIHASRAYPSRVVLPVVAPGESKDYIPD